MSKQSGTGTGAAGRLPSGTELGPYVIRSLIGAGGMGEVYRARDQRLDRDVAIKVLPPEAGQDPGRLRRFETEAKATAALSHPNILAIYDVGRHDGTSYLVTELLEGANLRQRMREGTMTVRDAVESAIRTARALSAAHNQGIVHRDLKPENLFLTRNGQLKVLDFGLARLPPPVTVTVPTLPLMSSGTRPPSVASRSSASPPSPFPG